MSTYLTSDDPNNLISRQMSGKIGVDGSSGAGAHQKPFAGTSDYPQPTDPDAIVSEPTAYGGGGLVSAPPAPAGPVSVAASTSNPRPGDAGPVNAQDAYSSPVTKQKFADSSGVAPTSYQAPAGPIANAASGLPSGSGPPAGMTTEQANAYYGPINRGMDAKSQQDALAQRQRSDLGQQGNILSWRQTQAENALRVANNSSARTGMGPVRLAMENLRAAQGASDTNEKEFANSGANRNFIQEAAAGQTLTQGAQNNQLEQAKGAQGIQAGAQGLQKGAFELKHAGMLQDLANRMMNTDPNSPDYEKLAGAYGLMTGNKPEDMKVLEGEQYTNPEAPMTPLRRPAQLVYRPPGTTVPRVLHTDTSQQAEPPPGHIAALKSGAVTDAQFDSKYGHGAAARAKAAQ